MCPKQQSCAAVMPTRFVRHLNTVLSLCYKYSPVDAVIANHRVNRRPIFFSWLKTDVSLATKCCYGEYHSLALFPSFLITFFRVHFFSSSPHHPTLPLHHQPGNFLSQRHLSLCSLDSFPSPLTVICGCTFPLCSFSPLAHTPFVSKACVSNQASISCTCTTFNAGMCNAWVVR